MGRGEAASFLKTISISAPDIPCNGSFVHMLNALDAKTSNKYCSNLCTFSRVGVNGISAGSFGVGIRFKHGTEASSRQHGVVDAAVCDVVPVGSGKSRAITFKSIRVRSDK